MRSISKCVFTEIKNNSGFTLIEAVITIFILGIIVVPLSTIFIGSLEQSRENEDMLTANQLSQLYLENLKARSYNDFDALFEGSKSIALDSAIDQGFPAIPQGYEVTLTYDDFSETSYKIDENSIQERDFTIYLESNVDKNYRIVDETDESTKDINVDVSLKDNCRVINIILENTNKYEIRGRNDVLIAEISKTNLKNVVNVIYSATDSQDDTTKKNIQTKINVTNKSTNDVTLNVYEHPDAKVFLEVPHPPKIAGKVIINNPLYLARSNSSSFIYKIGVKVTKNSEVLSQISTTRIEE